MSTANLCLQRAVRGRPRLSGRSRAPSLLESAGRIARVHIGVDIGGTFTDIVALDREGHLALTKVPSTPKDLLEGVGSAIRRVLDLTGASAAAVERFIHGTTVATNAVLEQKG